MGDKIMEELISDKGFIESFNKMIKNENNSKNVEHMKELTELGNILTDFSVSFDKNKDLIEDLKSMTNNLEKTKTEIDKIEELIEDMSNLIEMVITYLDTNKEIIGNYPKLDNNIEKVITINRLFIKKLTNIMNEELREKLLIEVNNIKEKTNKIKLSIEELTDCISRIENIKIKTKFDVNKNKNNLIKAAKLVRDVRDETENLAYLDGTLEEYEKEKLDKRFDME